MNAPRKSWWEKIFGRKKPTIRHYELIQGERNKETMAINYQIRRDGAVLVEQCDYIEGYNHLSKLMKVGDTMQELRKGDDSRILTYEEMMAGNIMMGNIEYPE